MKSCVEAGASRLQLCAKTNPHLEMAIETASCKREHASEMRSTGRCSAHFSGKHEPLRLDADDSKPWGCVDMKRAGEGPATAAVARRFAKLRGLAGSRCRGRREERWHTGQIW